MGFAGCDRRHGNPQGRGAPCASVGGYTRGEKRKRRRRRERERRPAGRGRLRSGSVAFRVFRPRPAALGFLGGFCVAVSRFLAKPIQNGFCGIRPLAREPAGACPALRVGRWVYEKALRGGRPAQAGRPHAAAFAGFATFQFRIRRSRVVPYGLPGYRRLRREPPLHPQPPRASSQRGLGGISEESRGAREYPDRAEGWALWVTGGSPRLRRSHRGYRRVGEAASGGRALPVGASSWGA